MNPAAEDILNISEERGKGRPARELLPDWPASHFLETGELQFELALGEEPDRRHYRLRDWPLNDFRGQAVGQLLLLTDVTDQKRTQAQILEQQRSLAILHERDQLARELHDNLGQVIAFVNIQGQTIHRLLSQGDHATAENYVGRLLEVVRDADMDIRDSIAGLRTSLSEYGFHPVLTEYLTNFERNFGIRTMLEGPFTCTAGLFEPLVEVQLLRILQEALTNVRKHAKARTVWIAFVQEGSCVSVTIRDNGQGFDANSIGRRPHGHVGLRVMRERAEEVGGSLSLISIPGEGTELVVRVPVKMSHQAQRIHQPGAENPG